MTDLTGAVWRKASRSQSGNQCVEVATNLADHGVVGVRDSKDPSGPAFALAPSTFAAFLGSIKDGQFDQ